MPASPLDYFPPLSGSEAVCGCIVYTVSCCCLATTCCWRSNPRSQEILRRLGFSWVFRTLFNDGVVASALFYGLSCWRCECTNRNRKRIKKLERRSGYVLGCLLESVTVVGESKMLQKLNSIMDTPLLHHHPLYGCTEQLLYTLLQEGALSQIFLPVSY